MTTVGAQQRTHNARHRRVQPASRWLRFRAVQLGWAVLALAVFALLPFRLQQTYDDARTLCTGMDCSGALLTRSELHVLRSSGLSADTWGIVTATIILVFACIYCTAAAIIVWRKPSDRMAVVTAMTLVLFGGLTFDTGAQPPADLPRLLWLPYDVLGLFGGYAMFAFLALFPSGRLALRWPLALFLPLAAFQASEVLARYSPLGGASVPVPVSGAAWALMLGSAIYVQVYRYRYVSSPVGRQQTKWVILGIALVIIGAAVTFSFYPLAPSHPALGLAPFPATHAVFLLIPLSIGIAILRSRLWDIDVLINRTLVYGSLTLTLALIYVGSVIGLQSLLQAVAGTSSDLTVAVSTLAIAALFTPLRRRFQTVIDRRFYRQKYDATRSLAAFGARLRNEVDLDQLSMDVMQVVEETVQPHHASLWLRGQRP